jgi:hypothetical protein
LGSSEGGPLGWEGASQPVIIYLAANSIANMMVKIFATQTNSENAQIEHGNNQKQRAIRGHCLQALQTCVGMHRVTDNSKGAYRFSMSTKFDHSGGMVPVRELSSTSLQNKQDRVNGLDVNHTS